MADAPDPEAGQGQLAQSSRPGGGRVSLGGALFGGFPADGHFIPADPVPGSWLDLYTEHADEDGSVHVGVYRSCRGGRDFTLREAGRARLTLHSKGAKDMAEWTRQLVGVRAALSTRVSKPTSVGLTVHNKDYLAAVSEQLQGAGQGITELRVKDEQVDTLPYNDSVAAQIDPRMTQFLSTLHLLCPNITTLDLHTLPCLLTPPSNLPRLTKVSVQWPSAYGTTRQQSEQQVCTSIGPYLPQLTSLQYHGCAWRSPFATVFTAATATHTLTHLNTTCRLSDELLGLLVKFAPAITHLTVFDLAVTTEQHQVKEWAVSELRLQYGCNMRTLARLPASRGLKVYIEHGLYILETAMSEQGLHPDIVGRLPTWQIHPKDPISLYASEVDQPSALRSTLRQLANLQTSCNEITLKDWTWTEDLGIAASEATAALAWFNLTVTDTDELILTDGVLRGLLRLGTHVVKLEAHRVELQTGCSDAVWPWQTFDVCDLDLGQVLKLPDPSAAQEPPTINADKLMITRVLKDDVELLRQRLQHLQLSPEHIEVHYPDSNHYDALRDQLSFLSSMGANMGSGQLKLHKWVMTKDTLTALRHLPPWSATLNLTSCTWPEYTAVYGELPMCVPITYTRWVLGKEVKPGTALLTSICAGINERRQGSESEPVTLVLYGTGGGGAKEKVGDHVIVQKC